MGFGHRKDKSYSGEGKPSNQPTQLNDPDVVHAAVEQAKFHLEFEDARLQRDQQRAGWLLALNGVLLGLIANQARETLNDATLLGELGRDLAAGALAFAALFSVISAVAALLSLVRVKTWLWDIRSLEALGSPESLGRPRDHVDGEFLNGLIERLKLEVGTTGQDTKAVQENAPDETTGREAQDRDPHGQALKPARISIPGALFEALRRPISSSARGKLLKAAFTSLTIALVAIAVHVGVWVERTIAHPRCPAPVSAVATTTRARLTQDRIPALVFLSSSTVASTGPSPYPTPGGCGGGKAAP